jgi:PRC-barrel domain
MSAKEYVYNSRLKELHASDYEMVKGEPDIRGWKVNTIQNQAIGKIVDLLFDEVSKRVRYLVIDLNGKPLNLISRNIIIPVGLAELHRSEKVVFFPELTVAHLASLPTYEKGKISLETEYAIRSVFAPNTGISYLDQDFHDTDKFYNHEHFNEERFYRPRIERVEENSDLKNEIKENIERVKDSVRKMEADVERLGKKEF